jgi:hypothetical protein
VMFKFIASLRGLLRHRSRSAYCPQAQVQPFGRLSRLSRCWVASRDAAGPMPTPARKYIPIPRRYRDFDKSALRRIVRHGGQVQNIELEP